MKICQKCSTSFDTRNCPECSREQVRNWRANNKGKVKAYRATRRTARREQNQSCVSRYRDTLNGHLSRLLYQAKARSSTTSGRRVIPFSLTKADLQNMWDSQKGVCAISGLTMTIDKNCPKCVSLDRKDSSGDYSVGNVQLVCRFMNLAKHTHSNEVMTNLISEIRALGKTSAL